MKRLLTIVLALAIAGIGSSAMAAVSGSPHDFTGVSTYSLCNPCHIPHAAKSSKRLWAQLAKGGGAKIDVTDGADWESSLIGKLCGSCHHFDMFTINAQNAGGDNPHQVEDSVYSTSSHGRSVTELTANVKDTPADLAARPYMSTWGAGLTANAMQCTSCHDPHNNLVGTETVGVKPFLRVVGAQDSISEVCAGCHDRYNATEYGTTNSMTRGANDAGSDSSMHPVDITYQDQVGNENVDATILRDKADMSVALNTPVADTENWRLGGKFEISTNSPGYLGCNTCHAIHGTNTGAAVGGNAAATNIYLLAIDNNGALPNAPLCEGCHGGSTTATFTSLAGAGGAFAAAGGSHHVANHINPADPGANDDHPFDMTPDGTPALGNWADAANDRFERTAWGARTAGDPQRIRDNWPYGAQGGYSTGGATFGNIICISCHSAHNGISNTSLRRKGGIVAGTTNPTAATMSVAATGDPVRASWCYNCHPQADMVPSYHHTTDTANVAGPSPANYTAGAIGGGNSAIWCGDCHTMSTVPTAHNGFFNLVPGKLTGNSNGSSDLCVACHGTADPSAGLNINWPGNLVGPGGGVPNGHVLENAGSDSHYIGTFVEGSNTNFDINVKRSWWRNISYKGASTNIYSKYGIAAGGGTDTHHTTAPATWSANQTVICESCHSVLFNAGWGGNAAYADWNAEGGWRTNLLLQLYEDRAPGTGQLAQTRTGYSAAGAADTDGVDTGSAFCIACHNQSARPNGLVTGTISWGGSIPQTLVPRNMHPMTGWTITRAKDAGRAVPTLITSDVGASLTYADATTRPDGGAGAIRASYPAQHAQDCDSCHRPHGGYGVIPGSPGTGTGAGNDVPAILEVGTSGSTAVDQVCVTCHNR